MKRPEKADSQSKGNGEKTKIRILCSFAKEENITVVLEHIYTPPQHLLPRTQFHSFKHDDHQSTE